MVPHQKNPRYFSILLLAVLCSGLQGCITLDEVYRPEELAVPAKVSCVQLPAPLAVTGRDGWLNNVWERRLEPGPYFSEKEDAEGTYYRGLPGSYLAARPDKLDQPEGENSHMRYDGGLWLPRDPKAMPRVYYYISRKGVAHEPAPLDCANLGYTRDPQSLSVNAFNWGVGGAAGGLVVRSAMTTSISYGQAAINGAVAGLVVIGLYNVDVGKVSLSQPIEDATFVGTVRSLAVVPLKEMPAKAPQPEASP